jgi:hypothetical protein
VGLRLTLKLLLHILVLEFGTLVRHGGGRSGLSDVLEVISVDRCVCGVRAMCGLPRGESSAPQTLKTGKSRSAGVRAFGAKAETFSISSQPISLFPV